MKYKGGCLDRNEGKCLHTAVNVYNFLSRRAVTEHTDQGNCTVGFVGKISHNVKQPTLPHLVLSGGGKLMREM